MMSARKSGFTLLASMLLAGGCSTVPHIDKHAPPLVQAATDLKYARRTSLPGSTRAALYLDAAALADSQLSQKIANPGALTIYNSATAEFTDLLRESDGGRLWNHPLVLRAWDTDYRFRFATDAKKGVWSPDYFTDFKLARDIRSAHIRRRVVEQGVGGLLVGIHKTPCPPHVNHAPFEPKLGLVAPVSATLAFRGREVALTLLDPTVIKTARLHGKPVPLAADLTAPFAFHRPVNDLWRGLMGLIDVEKYMRNAGLYMIGPYDPNRVPVILVHGLISTPQMWVNVMNELEADPQLRGRLQFWVFGYPSGNHPAYSALLCREELAKMQALHPTSRGVIMIGHSMGGLISRMQATSTARVLWNGALKERADRLYERVPESDPVKRSLIFNANPQVKDLVFICVPHRGSELALSSIGALARSLIKLPTSLVATLNKSVLEVLQTANGKVVMPNSITGLSPKDRILVAMDKLPIAAPYHSIIGDRGKGNTPNSSDGVVPYWSSHLASACSECIVPGPHGSYQLPETITELKRILEKDVATLRQRE